MAMFSYYVYTYNRYTDRRFCYILLADSDSLSDSKLNNNFATTMYVQAYIIMSLDMLNYNLFRINNFLPL